MQAEPDTDFAKRWKILYPVYLDKAASRQEGRKVSDGKAVEMPDIDDFI